MNFYFTLAWRYLWSKNRDTSITTMVRICFLGIFLGTLALTLVLCVMQGFEHSTREKLQSINPTLLIRTKDIPLDIVTIQNTLAQLPAIHASAPNIQQFVMVQDRRAKTLSTIATFKAIDPAQESRVSALARMIIQPPNIPLEKLIYENRVLIGHKLAQQLDCTVGDAITIWYAPDQNNTTKLEKMALIVNGIFRTGLEEYDLNLIVADLAFAQELFSEQEIDEIGITLKPTAPVEKIVQELKEHFFEYDVLSWYELYPALVGALKLEKYALFFIIMLITLVASMNIISLIFMQITQKRRDIAILQTYGMTSTTIRKVFFCIGLYIGLAGALCGLVAAYLIGLILYHFPFISLPDVYYTSHLPIVLDPSLFGIVFACVMMIIIIATSIPLRDIARIPIAHILRFEG